MIVIFNIFIIIKLIFFTSFSWVTVCGLWAYGVFLVVFRDELREPEYPIHSELVLMINIILIVTFILGSYFGDKAEYNCNDVEKLSLAKEKQNDYFNDDTYFKVMCDKGSIYIDDDEELNVNGHYTGMDTYKTSDPNRSNYETIKES